MPQDFSYLKGRIEDETVMSDRNFDFTSCNMGFAIVKSFMTKNELINELMLRLYQSNRQTAILPIYP